MGRRAVSQNAGVLVVLVFSAEMQYPCIHAVSITHWGLVTHTCVGNLTIIGSDNGLSPGRRQAIIWTNAWILLIGPIGTNFSEILIEISTFSFKKMYLKMSSAKWRPFCLSLNVIIHWPVAWIKSLAASWLVHHLWFCQRNIKLFSISKQSKDIPFQCCIVGSFFAWFLQKSLYLCYITIYD